MGSWTVGSWAVGRRREWVAKKMAAGREARPRRFRLHLCHQPAVTETGVEQPLSPACLCLPACPPAEFCKQQLWPVLHYLIPLNPTSLGRFDPNLWSAYVRANMAFANKLVEVRGLLLRCWLMLGCQLGDSQALLQTSALHGHPSISFLLALAAGAGQPRGGFCVDPRLPPAGAALPAAQALPPHQVRRAGRAGGLGRGVAGGWPGRQADRQQAVRLAQAACGSQCHAISTRRRAGGQAGRQAGNTWQHMRAALLIARPMRAPAPLCLPLQVRHLPALPLPLLRNLPHLPASGGGHPLYAQRRCCAGASSAAALLLCAGGRVPLGVGLPSAAGITTAAFNFPTHLSPPSAPLCPACLPADLIGFHTFDYARHFLSCCSRMLGLEHKTSRGSIIVEYYGRDVGIKIMPTGGWVGRQRHLRTQPPTSQLAARSLNGPP